MLSLLTKYKKPQFPTFITRSKSMSPFHFPSPTTTCPVPSSSSVHHQSSQSPIPNSHIPYPHSHSQVWSVTFFPPMSNSRFLLDNFRPWNPTQDNPQQLPEPAEICRYPSPVSITATLPSSTISRDIASKVLTGNPGEIQRHPLPARPPVEVCLNDESQSCSPPTRCGIEVTRRNVPTEENLQASEPECPAQTQETRDTINIDPEILHDNFCADAGHIAKTGTYQNIASTVTHSSSESPFINTNRPSRSNQQDSDHTETSNRQVPKVTKRSYTRKKSTGRGPGRPPKNRNSVLKNVSFSSVRSQFSAMSVEDRLQFLSWLFEGALPHCVSTSTSASTAAASNCGTSLGADTVHDYALWDSNTEPADVQKPPSHHLMMLAPYHGRPSREEDISGEIESDNQLEYEIERILEHRKGARGSLSYLVKWKGYEDVEATWEPHDSVQDTAALDNYELQLATTT